MPFLATLLALGLMALAVQIQPAQAQEFQSQRLRIAPAGPAPEDGRYAAGDDVEFLIDHRDGAVRLRFVVRDEVFYLTNEPAALGGRILKYDTGATALAVSGWGGVTLYTQRAPNGIPAERTGEAQSLDTDPVTERGTQLLAESLSRHLAERYNLAVGFAADWDGISDQNAVRALAADSIRNAAYALAELAAAPGAPNAAASRIGVVRIVAGTEMGVRVENEALTVVFAADGGPWQRPSSLAITETLLEQP